MIRSRAESLISAIKRLRGKPTSVEPVGPNEYRYESPGGSVTVNGDVHKLIQNQTIHNSVTYVFGKPAEQEEVTGIETYLSGREKETKVVVDKNDAPAFEAFSTTPLPATTSVEEHISEPTTYFLKPKRVSVEGEADNWSFRYGTNQTLRVDVVRDQHFLDNVKNGIYRLSSDDLIVAEVVQKQRIQGTQIVGEPRYEIVQVLEYRPSPRNLQGKLFERSSGPDN